MSLSFTESFGKYPEILRQVEMINSLLNPSSHQILSGRV